MSNISAQTPQLVLRSGSQKILATQVTQSRQQELPRRYGSISKDPRRADRAYDLHDVHDNPRCD